MDPSPPKTHQLPREVIFLSPASKTPHFSYSPEDNPSKKWARHASSPSEDGSRTPPNFRKRAPHLHNFQRPRSHPHLVRTFRPMKNYCCRLDDPLKEKNTVSDSPRHMSACQGRPQNYPSKQFKLPRAAGVFPKPPVTLPQHFLPKSYSSKDTSQATRLCASVF